MKRSRTQLAVLLAVLLGVVGLAWGVAYAAGEMIPRSVMSSGGDHVAAGDIAMRGVLGQPIAGRVSVSEGGLCSGFECGSGSLTNLPTPTTPPTVTPSVTGTPPTATPSVTGTPPTSTPVATGTPGPSTSYISLPLLLR
jgi:hypothetical protein